MLEEIPALCQRCGEREATHHITSVLSPTGQMVRRHLCAQCFAEVGSEPPDFDATDDDKPKA